MILIVGKPLNIAFRDSGLDFGCFEGREGGVAVAEGRDGPATIVGGSVTGGADPDSVDGK